jgi:DNA-binding NarL/FixJ family response regulator
LEKGREALAEGRWVDARAAFGEAWEAEESGEAAEGMAEACRWLGDPATLDVEEQAFRYYMARGEKQSAGRMATLLAIDNLDFRWDPAIVGGWLRRAHRLLDDDRDCAEYGWLLAWEAHIDLMVRNDSDGAIAGAVRAAEVGRALGISDLEVLALAVEGLALVTGGDIDQGMGRLDESCTAVITGEVSDANARATAICYLMDACDRVRDYDRAEQWCARAQEISRGIHAEALMGVCRPHYAVVLMWQGRWAEAEEQLLLGNQEIIDFRPQMVVEGVVRLAELRWRQGRWDEARDLFEQVKHAELAQLGRAELALSEGDPDQALDLTDKYLRRIPAHDRIERAFGLEVRVRALIAAGQAEAAEEHVRELDEIAEKAPTDPIRATSSVARGTLAAARGDHALARAALEDATDYYERHGAPFEAARARLEMAASLAALGRTVEAERAALAALESFEAVGAAREAARAAEAVRRINPASSREARLADASGLSQREIEVLGLLAKGMSNQEIARILVLSVRTVERHISTIYDKIGVSGRAARAAATAYAIRRGLA